MAFSANAQEYKGLDKFNIHLGMAIPTGDFASTSSENAGYANTGFDLALEYERGISEYLGIGAKLFVGANYFNGEELLDDFSQPNASTSVSATGYVALGFMFKGFFNYPLGEKTALRLDGGLGLASFGFPDIEVSHFADGNSSRVDLSGESASALCYEIGGGFVFSLSETVGLITRVGYMAGNPEIETTTESYLNGTLVDSDSETFESPRSNLNLSLGLSIAF